MGVGLYFLFENLSSKRSSRLVLGNLELDLLDGIKIFFLFLSQDQKIEPYLTSLNFWIGGGFVFYGGLFLGLFYIFCYTALLKKIPFERLHLLLPALIWGHAIGRIGCFMAGCCYGSICTLPWKVFLNGHYRHPVPLYEAAWLACLGLVVSILLKKKASFAKTVSTYLIGYAGGRFVLEFFRGDSIRGVFLNLSSSQFISLMIIVLIFSYILRNMLTKHKPD